MAPKPDVAAWYFSEHLPTITVPSDDWPYLYLERRTVTPLYLSMMAILVAFLLIETKFVAAVNLLWGATWITSAVVFGSILLTVLIATLMADRRPIGWKPAGVGLVLALLAVHATPMDALR